MHVIAARTIYEFAHRHADARAPLMTWLATALKAEWERIEDVRSVYPHADAVRVSSGNHVIVFNIKGNAYRLVAAIHFNRGKLYTLRFMTHAAYSKDTWKGTL